MLVTELGIVTLLREVQSRNAPSPMLYPLVITTSFKLDFGILLIANVGMLAYSIGQPTNASSPMLVTESGIVTLVILSQPSNA